jgi:TniQ
MLPRLFPSLPLGSDESPTSFVSRLARLHRAPSAVVFCTDLGFTFQKFVIGDADALNSLADIAGVPPEAMSRNALRREEDGWSLRGERLSKPSLRRGRLCVCPLCLGDDIASRSDLPAHLAIYGRTIWLIDHFRSCPRHGVALVLISERAQVHATHDFSGRLLPFVGDIDELISKSVPRPSTAMERYLLRRHDGAKGQAPWLDALQFGAAAKVCEMIGAVATFGRRPYLTRLTEDDWYKAGAAGFEITKGGEPAIRDFLTGLQSTYERSLGGKEQPNAFYGRLYQWLMDSGDAAFDPLRDVARQHAIETLPLGPQDVLFGKPVEKRVLHSLYTASIEYGIHTERLRNMLAAKGLLSEHDKAATANLVYFDAAAAHEFLSRAGDGLPLRQVEKYLNAGRVHAKLLADHGFIKPVVAASDPGIGGNAFALADLDDFLARLLAGAVPVAAVPDGAYDIPMVAKRANCSAMEVVRLILDGKLDWVGRLTGVAGYFSVLVMVAEVKQLVRGARLDGLTTIEIEDAMKTSFAVVKALIANGHFPVRQVINPVTRHAIKLVARADVEAFRAEYVSLAELAVERGLHLRKLFVRLRAQGIHPALDPGVYKARFYRRAIIGDG